MSGFPFTPDPADKDDERVWWLPNGRYVLRNPATGECHVQPPNDNWWHVEPSVEKAVAWFDDYVERLKDTA